MKTADAYPKASQGETSPQLQALVLSVGSRATTSVAKTAIRITLICDTSKKSGSQYALQRERVELHASPSCLFPTYSRSMPELALEQRIECVCYIPRSDYFNTIVVFKAREVPIRNNAPSKAHR